MTPALLLLGSPVVLLAAVSVYARVAGRRARARRVSFDAHAESTMRMLGARR